MQKEVNTYLEAHKSPIETWYSLRVKYRPPKIWSDDGAPPCKTHEYAQAVAKYNSLPTVDALRNRLKSVREHSVLFAQASKEALKKKRVLFGSNPTDAPR